MKLRDVARALTAQQCMIKSDDGNHTKWMCPCGKHSANIPQHRVVSPGRSPGHDQAAGLPAEGMVAVKSYTAHAQKWDGGWELHIDGVGVTQSRTLRDAERMVRSYISMDTGEARDAFAVEVVPDLGGLETRVRRVRGTTEKAEEAQRNAAAMARTVVRDLKGWGLSGNDIAAVLHVSPQRVSQLAKPERAVTQSANPADSVSRSAKSARTVTRSVIGPTSAKSRRSTTQSAKSARSGRGAKP